MRFAPPLALLLLSSPAFSQAYTYDAGVAGNPPQAPDPLTQGWGGAVISPATVKDISPDPDWGINAWQITDPGAGCVHYTAPLMGRMFTVGYEFDAQVRLLAGDSVYLGIATGGTLADSMWEITLDTQGPDVVVRDYYGTQIVCPGGADGQYHSFAMRNPTGANIVDLEFYYDGVKMGMSGEVIGWAAAKVGIAWGTGKYLSVYSGCGATSTGRARFHRVQFRTLDYGDLGSNYCGPAVNNSSGLPGTISAVGLGQATLNDFTLTASQLPTNQYGYFLASQTQGFITNPGGSQGNLCLGGQIARFSSQIQYSGSSGAFSILVDLTSIPTTPPHSVLAGETWNFQAWFRDKNPGVTSNFTDGVSVLFQ